MIDQEKTEDLKREQRSVATKTDKLAADLIAQGIIKRKPRWWRPAWWRGPHSRVKVAAVVLGVAAMLAAAYHAILVPEEPSSVPGAGQVAAVLVGGAAGIFTYQQWADSRREESLDRFYQRLGEVNSLYREWESARDLVPHFWEFAPGGDETAHQKQLYVYLELDNLEYMLVRYELGFVSQELLMRALRTFASRMVSKDFRDLATDQVDGAGYVKDTGEVVTKVCEELNDLERAGRAAGRRVA